MQFLPKRLPGWVVKIQRIDILIFLWRIFRIANGAVRAAPEPVGVLFEPGVIGRTLNRDVERDLHVQRFRSLDQRVEIVERPELRMNGVMTAFNGTDRRWTSGIARLGRKRIVSSFAIDAADGMNRCEVENVETHRGDIWQARDTVAKGPVLSRD